MQKKKKKPYTPLNDENMAGHFPVLFEDIEAQNLDDYLASKSSWTPNKDQKKIAACQNLPSRFNHWKRGSICFWNSCRT